MYEEWSLVWQPCSPGGELGRHFGVERYRGYLPFFVDGENLARLRHGGEVELDELALLKGILCGLSELDGEGPIAEFQQDRTTLYYLLNYLGTGFGRRSPEQMILNVAAQVRRRNGPVPAATVLREGTRLVRGSSKIRGDLILTLWELLEETPEAHRKPLLREIPALYVDLVLDDVMEAAREMIVYIAVAALAVLGRKVEADRLYASEGARYIRSPRLRETVSALFEAAEPQLSECFR